MQIKRGDIVLVDLKGSEGNETANDVKGNPRPCLVVQNDRGNYASSTTIVAPINTRPKSLPVHVELTPADMGDAGTNSIIHCEQLRTIDESRIVRVLKPISAEKMDEVDQALKISLGLG